MNRVIRSKMFIPLTLLVGLLVTSFGLVACGGGGGPDAQEIIKKSFSQDKESNIKAGKINLTVKGDLEGIKDFSGPFNLKLSGPFDATDEKKFPRFDISFSLSAGDTNVSAGALSTSDKMFVKFSGTNYSVPDTLFGMVKSGYEQAQQQAETEKKEEDSDSDDKTSTTGTSPLGVNPESWLTDLEKKSDVDIGGKKTYEVTGKIDVAKVIDDISKAAEQATPFGGAQTPQLTDEDKKQLKESIKDISFTLNSTTDDFIVVRFEFKAGFTIPEDQQKDLNGLESGNIELSYELTDIGEKPEMTPPKDPKPLEDLLNELGLGDAAASLGALSGGSIPGLPGGSTGTDSTPDTPPSGGDSGETKTLTTPGGPSTKATQEYLKCVQKADGPEDLQKCVEKLQK